MQINIYFVSILLIGILLHVTRLTYQKNSSCKVLSTDLGSREVNRGNEKNLLGYLLRKVVNGMQHRQTTDFFTKA